MSRDAMRACLFADERRRDRVRLAVAEAAITRLAQRGHVVNIDAEFEHEI
jgi:hypothetical protein